MFYSARTAMLVAQSRIAAERESAARDRRWRGEDDDMDMTERPRSGLHFGAIRRLIRRGRQAQAWT